MEIIEQDGIRVERREGTEAQDYMNSLLMQVAGAAGMEDAHRILVGRPRISRDEKADTTVHFKVPKSWRTMIVSDAASQNMTVSEYMRDLTLRRHEELAAHSA